MLLMTDGANVELIQCSAVCLRMSHQIDFRSSKTFPMTELVLNTKHVSSKYLNT